MVIVWSIVCCRPMTSKATSAPRCPVNSITALTASRRLASTTAVAPNLRRQLQLGRVDVHRDDLAGARDDRALDDVEPHPAAADHRHAVARGDVGGVQRRPDSGEHAAADERGDASSRGRRGS